MTRRWTLFDTLCCIAIPLGCVVVDAQPIIGALLTFGALGFLAGKWENT